MHRNLGNVVSNGDLSSGSAIEWALEMLKVRFHIISNPISASEFLILLLLSILFGFVSSSGVVEWENEKKKSGKFE